MSSIFERVKMMIKFPTLKKKKSKSKEKPKEVKKKESDINKVKDRGIYKTKKQSKRAKKKRLDAFGI